MHMIEIDRLRQRYDGLTVLRQIVGDAGGEATIETIVARLLTDYPWSDRTAQAAMLITCEARVNSGMRAPIQVLAKQKQQVAERRHKLAQLRLAGIRDQRQLAVALGVDRSTVSRDLAALTAEFREHASAQIAVEKGLDLERAEEMIKALWQKALSGNARAAEVVLQWVRFRPETLGYLAPTKRIELTPELVEAEVERIRREIAELEAAPVRASPYRQLHSLPAPGEHSDEAADETRLADLQARLRALDELQELVERQSVINAPRGGHHEWGVHPDDILADIERLLAERVERDPTFDVAVFMAQQGIEWHAGRN